MYRCRKTYIKLRPISSNWPETSSRPIKETVIQINSYIIDAADLLWRMRAFTQSRPKPPPGSTTFLGVVPRSVLQSLKLSHLGSAASLLTHRAFVGFAMAFIEEVKYCVYFSIVYRVAPKSKLSYFVHIFAKSWPILTIFSPVDSVRNLLLILNQQYHTVANLWFLQGGPNN